MDNGSWDQTRASGQELGGDKAVKIPPPDTDNASPLPPHLTRIQGQRTDLVTARQLMQQLCAKLQGSATWKGYQATRMAIYPPCSEWQPGRNHKPGSCFHFISTCSQSNLCCLKTIPFTTLIPTGSCDYQGTWFGIAACKKAQLPLGIHFTTKRVGRHSIYDAAGGLSVPDGGPEMGRAAY